ncbi:hypothetical protein [Telluribacter sp.]|jgi:hypothetical protein|uniref:hypothetical protein n=1 Tax=Telluribacter sp. TaxID=1978767 RepID=UPI002E166DD4|nr:hypothetical protein [Telluribacter sp.]
MTTEPVQYTIALVTIGSFNPVIISPAWLQGKGALGKQETESANIDIIHRELTQFSLSWSTCRVTPERFELICDSISYFEPMRDLFQSIFKVLRETPVNAIGINHVIVFDLGNATKFDQFGKFLATMDIWDETISHSKLKTIEILEQPRKDNLPGYRNIKLEGISNAKAKYGISISINDHFEVKSVSDMLDVISKNWQSSFDQTKLITTSLWNQFLKRQ